MTARRLLAAAGRLSVAGAAGVALTACEAPAPIVTVFSGTSSQWKEADVWCFEGQSLDEGDCAQRAEGPVQIEVTPGERIGVDVSKEVAERGWVVELSTPGGQPQSSEPQDGHYFAFTAPNVSQGELELTVRALGEQGQGETPSGEWTFELVPEPGVAG